MENDGRIRASDADREKVVSILRAAYSEGRLTLEEFDERTSAAYAAKTWSALRELTNDLPVTVQLGPGSEPAMPGMPSFPAGLAPGDVPQHGGGTFRFFPVPLVPVAVLLFLAVGGHGVLVIPALLIIFVWLRMISRHNYHQHHHGPDGPPDDSG